MRPCQVTVTSGGPLSVDQLERRGEGEEPRDRIVNALRERVAELDKGR